MMKGPRVREKDYQKLEIFQAIASDEQLSRKDIIHKLSLRSSTVSAAVSELLSDGLVLEAEKKDSGRPGRPEFGLIPLYQKFVAISVHMSGLNLFVHLLNLKGELLVSRTVPVDSGVDNNTFNIILENALTEVIHALPSTSILTGVGASFMGRVDSENYRWVGSDRWQNIKDYELGWIIDKLNIPLRVERNLDQELTYLLMGLHTERNQTENALLFHWGHGVGAAYAHSGLLMKSSFGEFSDIGHTTILPHSSDQCRCGAFGCLETKTALWALLPSLRRKFPELSENTPDIARYLNQPSVIDLPEVNEAITWIEVWLTNLFKILFPERIYFVGPFFQNHFIRSSVEKRFLERISPMLRERIVIKVVPDGFAGCITANASHFLQTRLLELLRSRW